MHKISNKLDCLDHIQSLFGGPNETETGDRIWLDVLNEIGMENLPYDILKRVAAKMLHEEGERVVFEEFEQ